EFHHEIADALLPQADPVLHAAAALDTALDRLDPQPPLMERLVRPWKRHTKGAVPPGPAHLCLPATRGRGRALSFTRGSRGAQRALHARAGCAPIRLRSRACSHHFCDASVVVSVA